ncbi:MAG: ferrous iron transporter B [Firmicutes bacterium]|nr:ferrous iron transporter B [Bacillota bacterium]
MGMGRGKRTRRIVLAGNPNVGKSAIFNALTGLYAEVSNFPGTTVEVTSGRMGEDLLLDTPGVYGVSSFNDEERVARDVILTADVVLNVVDAVHLERDLFLTLQLTEMGIPVVVALNMADELAARGLAVDDRRLSALLGVPVIPTVAVRRRGLREVRQALGAAGGRPDRDRAARVLEAENDQARREEIYLDRRRRANAIAREVKRETRRGTGLGFFLDRLSLEPSTGLPLLAVVLAGLYYLIGDVVAQRVVDFTEGTLMLGIYQPWIRSLVGRPFPPGSLPGALLVGEYGLLTMTVTYLLGLILPLVLGFYLALSALEDSGYLPRVAVLADRSMTGLGLNGRAIIPLILGLGCVTMATITTRILGNRRERTIATFLLALTVPCSAQLGVIAAVLAPIGPGYLAIYAGIILAVFVASGTVLDRLLPGEPTPLFMDLPPLRMPRAENLLKKTINRAYGFVMEAGPLFAYGALAIALLDHLGGLQLLERWTAPLTESWLGLPREAATAFVMGMIRRDFGAAGLYNLGLAPVQSLVAMVTMTLFVPCVASLMTILKERGRWEGILIWLATLVVAFALGGVVARVAAVL